MCVGAKTSGRLERVPIGLLAAGYASCSSYLPPKIKLGTTDGKRVSAACPRHWGEMLRVFQWHFYSQEEHTLHFLCGSGPDLDAPCPYVCSKTQPVMLPVAHFTLFSFVASSTPKNNHHQCHMVSKIKGPSSEYISS